MRSLAFGLLALAGFACVTPAAADEPVIRGSRVTMTVRAPVHAARVYSYIDGYRWGGAVYHAAYAYEPGIVQSSWVDPAYVYACRATVVRTRWGVRRTRECG